MNDSMQQIGVVAIGRNEGTRLMACLRSIVGDGVPVVYVDSGSTDGSIAAAKQLGAEVVELDTSVPFTAARARNAGIGRLLQLHPHLVAIQCVDGDCQVVAGWLDAARASLDERADVAVVCGRRREQHREATIYNTLADIEWDTPVGETGACGGDAMYRRAAFEQVQGFDKTLICGEEPELCLRLRAAGWKVLRIDRDMTLHDAAITRFGQWWRRLVRSGWAYAQGAAMYGRLPERYCIKPRRSIWFWGAIVPLTTLILAAAVNAWFVLLLLSYPAMAAKIAVCQRRRGSRLRDAILWGVFCMIGKFPQMIGQCRYWLTRLRGKRATLIEYKGQDRPVGTHA